MKLFFTETQLAHQPRQYMVHGRIVDPFENPNRALALAIAILNSQEWKDGNANFPNTNFEAVALKSGDFNASAIIPAMPSRISVNDVRAMERR